MRTIFLMICFFVSSFKLLANEEINVLVWNIWHGGKSKELSFNDGRPEIVEVVKQAKADIVILIETYGSAEYFSEELDYNYKLLSSNLCILSKYEILNTHSFDANISSFNFGGVDLKLDGGDTIRVFDTWLHYLPDTRKVPTSATHDSILKWENQGSRDDEIKTILHQIQPMIAAPDRYPIIMGGDFNSHSHLDWTSKTKDMYNHGGAVVNWTVSSMMQAYGFKDAVREHYPNPENFIGATNIGGHRIDSLGVYHYELMRNDRIDYIYYQGEKLKLIEAHSLVTQLGTEFTYKGKKFLYPSDHGFVVAKFEFSK